MVEATTGGAVSAAAGSHAPKPAATPAAKASDDKKTITLVFEADDLAIHERIVSQAKDEERAPNVELLRFIRKHFPKGTPAA